jgi:hypothetical protein
MPQHKDILVSKAHGDAPEHEHLMVAIKDAFAEAIFWQLWIKEMSGEKRAIAVRLKYQEFVASQSGLARLSSLG